MSIIVLWIALNSMHCAWDAQDAASHTASPDAARIDAVLTQLEARGDTVQDLICRVEYTIEDVLVDDKYTKFGEIRYKKSEPNAVFYIHFDKLHQSGVVKRKKEWYIFDGRYLWEIKEAAKNRIQHEIVGPGETIDLFDIEQSPIPVPFGQKKEQILRNFDVVLAPPADGDPPNTDHLICTPKTDNRVADDFDRIEFYVSRELHLPLRIVSVDRGGAHHNTAVFPDISTGSINTGLPDAKFALPEETKNWPTVLADPDAGLPTGAE